MEKYSVFRSENMQHLFDVMLPSNEIRNASLKQVVDGNTSMDSEKFAGLIESICDARTMSELLIGVGNVSEFFKEATNIARQFDADIPKLNLHLNNRTNLSGFVFDGRNVVVDCDDFEGHLIRDVLTQEPVQVDWSYEDGRMKATDDNGATITFFDRSLSLLVFECAQYAKSEISKFEDSLRIFVD